jgi:hypothetical protein
VDGFVTGTIGGGWERGVDIAKSPLMSAARPVAPTCSLRPRDLRGEEMESVHEPGHSPFHLRAGRLSHGGVMKDNIRKPSVRSGQGRAMKVKTGLKAGPTKVTRGQTGG